MVKAWPSASQFLYSGLESCTADPVVPDVDVDVPEVAISTKEKLDFFREVSVHP